MNGEMRMKITQTTPDTFGTIKTISGDEHFINRITSIGVTPGAAFQTVRNDKKMPVLTYLRNGAQHDIQRVAFAQTDGTGSGILYRRRTCAFMYRLSYCGAVKTLRLKEV